MSYYDRLTDIAFKKDGLDRDIFFTTRSKGRILPNAEMTTEVRRRLKIAITTHLVLTPVVVILLFFLDYSLITVFVSAMLTMALCFVMRYALIWPLIRNLPLSEEKLTSRETYERHIAIYSRRRMVTLLGLAVLLLCGGALFFLVGAWGLTHHVAPWLDDLVPNRNIRIPLDNMAPVMFAIGVVIFCFRFGPSRRSDACYVINTNYPHRKPDVPKRSARGTFARRCPVRNNPNSQDSKDALTRLGATP